MDSRWCQRRSGDTGEEFCHLLMSANEKQVCVGALAIFDSELSEKSTGKRILFIWIIAHFLDNVGKQSLNHAHPDGKSEKASQKGCTIL